MERIVAPSGATWSEFMSSVTSANVFQSPEMSDVYHSTKGYSPRTFCIEGSNGIEALLSCVLISYLKHGTTPLSTRSLIVGGPIGNPALCSTLLAAHDRFAAGRAVFTEIRNLHAPEDLASFADSGYVWEDHLNFYIDLTKGKPATLNAMSRERRKGIRRAQQNRVEVANLEMRNLESGYTVLHETYAKARVPLADISLFASAFRCLSPTKHLFAWGAFHDGELCAVRFTLAWRSTLFDWYAGSTEQGRKLRANELLVWEILRFGIDQGYSGFDFGGAGRPQEVYGPGEFKRTFGGAQFNPGRFVKVHHPLCLRLSTAAYNMWRRVR